MQFLAEEKAKNFSFLLGHLTQNYAQDKTGDIFNLVAVRC